MKRMKRLIVWISGMMLMSACLIVPCLAQDVTAPSDDAGSTDLVLNEDPQDDLLVGILNPSIVGLYSLKSKDPESLVTSNWRTAGKVSLVSWRKLLSFDIGLVGSDFNLDVEEFEGLGGLSLDLKQAVLILAQKDDVELNPLIDWINVGAYYSKVFSQVREVSPTEWDAGIFAGLQIKKQFADFTNILE